jgi:hypothetical protein
MIVTNQSLILGNKVIPNIEKGTKEDMAIVVFLDKTEVTLAILLFQFFGVMKKDLPLLVNFQ